MLKKILCMVLSAAMLMGILCACGNTKTDDGKNSATQYLKSAA